MENLDERYKNICLKLWGEEQGEEIHEWIITNRPVAFQRKLMEVMVPIWEMDKVDMRTKYFAVSPLLPRLDAVR